MVTSTTNLTLNCNADNVNPFDKHARSKLVPCIMDCNHTSQK